MKKVFDRNDKKVKEDAATVIVDDATTILQPEVDEKQEQHHQQIQEEEQQHQQELKHDSENDNENKKITTIGSEEDKEIKIPSLDKRNNLNQQFDSNKKAVEEKNDVMNESSTNDNDLEESITVISYDDEEDDDDDDDVSIGFVSSRDENVACSNNKTKRKQQQKQQKRHQNNDNSSTTSNNLEDSSHDDTLSTSFSTAITNSTKGKDETEIVIGKDAEHTLQNIRDGVDIDTTTTTTDARTVPKITSSTEQMVIEESKVVVNNVDEDDGNVEIATRALVTETNILLCSSSKDVTFDEVDAFASSMSICNSSHSSDATKTRVKKRKSRQQQHLNNPNNISLDKAQRIDELGRSKLLCNKLDEALEAYSLSLKVKTCLLKGNDISFADTIQGMGEIYYRKKEILKAITAFQEVVRLRRIHLQSNEENDVLEKFVYSLDLLAACMEVNGDIDTANLIRNEHYLIVQQRYGESNLITADVLEIIAMNHLELEHYEESLTHFLQALRIKRRVCSTSGNDNEHSRIATTLNLIGNVYFAKHEYENAMEAFIESFDIRRKILGPDHLESSNSLSNIGNVLMAMHRFAEALTMYQQANDIRKKKLGDCKHNMSIASSLNDIADAYASLHQYLSALKKYSEAYKMYKRLLGSHHPDVANAVYNMAKMHKQRHYFEKAKNRFIQGGNIHLYNKCIEDALWNFSKALECALSLRTTTTTTVDNDSDNKNSKSTSTILIATSNRDKDDHALANKLLWIAAILQWKIQDTKGSIKAYTKVLSLLQEMKGDDHLDVAHVHEHLGFLYQQSIHKTQQKEQQQLVLHHPHSDAALHHYEEALRIKKLSNATKQNKMISCHDIPLLTNIALLYKQKGDIDKAIEFSIEISTLKQFRLASIARHHISLAATQRCIGLLYREKGDCPTKALEYLQSAIIMLQNNSDTNTQPNINPIQMANMFHEIGDIHYDQENYVDVVHSYQNAFMIWNTLKESEYEEEGRGENSSGNDNGYCIIPFLAKQRFIDARFKLGISLRSVGEYTDAIREFQEALRLRRLCVHVQQQGEDNNISFIADTSNELGTCYLQLNDMEQSECMYKEALAIRKELLQQVKHRISLENNNANVTSSFSITKICTFGSSIKEDFPNPKKKLIMFNEPNDEILHALEQVILTLCRISHCYVVQQRQAQNNNDTALSVLQNARYLAHSQRGGHLLEARVLDQIGIFYAKKNHDKKNISMAFSSWKDAIALRKLEKMNDNDNDHIENSFSFNEFGNLYFEDGHYEKAMRSYTDALTIQMNYVSNDHVDLMNYHRNIGKVCNKLSNFTKALESYTEALRIAKLHHGVHSSQVADILSDVAFTQTKLQQYKDAVTLYIGCATIHQENSQFLKALEAYNAAIQVPLVPNDNTNNKSCSITTTNDQLSSAKKLESFGQILLFTNESKEDLIDLAVQTYKEVLRVYQELLGKDHMDFVSALEILGDIYNMKSDFDAAMQSYLEVLRVKTQMYGNTSIDVANVLSKVANTYLHQKKYDNAIDIYNDVLYLNQQLRGGDHASVSSTIRNIGLVYHANNENVTAMGFFQNAMVKVKHADENNLDVAIIANDIGDIHFEESRYREALTAYQEVMDVRFNMLGCDYADVGEAHGKIGRCHMFMGDYRRAIISFQEYLRIQKLQDGTKKKRSIGNNKIDIHKAVIYQYLGDSYLKRMELAEANNAYIEALTTRKEILSKLQIESSSQARRSKSNSKSSTSNDNINDIIDRTSNGSKDVVTLLAAIARICEKQGKSNAALQYYLECKDHRVNISSVDSLPILIESYIKIGDLYQDNDEEDANSSIQTYCEALSMQRQWISLKKSELANTLKMIKGVLYKSDRYESALQSFKNCQRDLASLYFKVGVCYKENKDYAKGIETLKEALRFSELEYGSNHLHLAVIYDTIGHLYAEFQNYNSSLAQFQLSLGIRRQQLGDDNVEVASTLYKIACVLESNENYERSLEAFQEVLQILRSSSKDSKKINSNDPFLADTFVKTAEISRTLGNLDDAQKYYEESLALRKKELYNSREFLRRSIHNGQISYNNPPNPDNQEYYDSAISVQKSARNVANILSILDIMKREREVAEGVKTSAKKKKISNTSFLFKDVKRMAKIGGDGGMVVVREEPEIILV